MQSGSLVEAFGVRLAPHRNEAVISFSDFFALFVIGFDRDLFDCGLDFLYAVLKVELDPNFFMLRINSLPIARSVVGMMIGIRLRELRFRVGHRHSHLPSDYAASDDYRAFGQDPGSGLGGGDDAFFVNGDERGDAGFEPVAMMMCSLMLCALPLAGLTWTVCGSLKLPNPWCTVMPFFSSRNRCRRPFA